VSASRRLAGALFATAALALGPSSGWAQVALEGRVVAGSDSTPAGPHTVELHRVGPEGGTVLDSVRAGADGRFRFSIDTAGAGSSLFLAAVRRDGVVYFGPPLHAGMAADGPYRVVVYDTAVATGPVGGARIALRHIVVSPAGDGTLEVAEIFDVVGTGDRTWVPGPDSVAVFRAPLPAGVRSWERLEGGLPERAVRVADGGLEIRAALSPAGFRAGIAYLADGPDLVIPVEHPTDRLDVILVGAEARRVEGLVPGGAPAMAAGGAARRFVGSDLLPGSRVRVEVMVPTSSRSRAVLWLGIGLALLAAAALSSVLARRERGPH
jgi:hypothetical protein